MCLITLPPDCSKLGSVMSPFPQLKQRWLLCVEGCPDNQVAAVLCRALSHHHSAIVSQIMALIAAIHTCAYTIFFFFLFFCPQTYCTCANYTNTQAHKYINAHKRDLSVYCSDFYGSSISLLLPFVLG